MKKTISLLMSVVMLLSFAMGMNLTVLADDGKTITSATLTPAKPYTIYEGNYAGYSEGTDDKGNPYREYFYFAPDFNAGDVVDITFSDGTTDKYTYYVGDSKDGGWYNSDDEKIYICYHVFTIDTADGLGTAYASYGIMDSNYNDYGYDIEDVPVEIIENPVESFSLTPAKAYEITEGTNGYYSDEENETDWYYWAPHFNEGDKITVNYTDGTSEDFVYEGDIWDFVNDDNEILNVYSNSFEFDGTGKTTFIVKLSHYGKRINVPVEIVENPVKSFSLTPVKAYEITEGTNGYYDKDRNQTYYYAPAFNEGDKITVNYTDGTSEDFVYKEGEIRDFVNDDNEILNVYRYGFEFDGTGKTTFEVKLPDYGRTTDVPVTIAENPVYSFSFTPAKAYEITEGTNGYYSDEENETDWYYWAPHFNEGDKITVNYTDGTSEEFVYEGEICDFVNDDNEILNVYSNGFEFDGTGKTTFEVKLADYGKTINVPVTVIENPVDSFSFTSVNPYEVEHSKGYAEDEDWWLEAPDFNKGDYVTVYFKDGTHDVYTCKEDGGCEFYNSNNEMVTVYSYEFSFNGTGTTSFTVKLYEYGKTQQVPVTVVDNSSSGSTPGGSTSGGGSTGGSTSGDGSTGGGGAVPAPAPTTDDSQKTEEQKPSTSTTTTTTTSTQTPATVKVSKTKAKKNGVVVTWKTAKDVTGYEIQLATDKKFKKNKKTVKVNKKNASKKTVKKLKSKKKYYVRVRSYKIVNGKKVYGKWSKVKTVKTK